MSSNNNEEPQASSTIDDDVEALQQQLQKQMQSQSMSSLVDEPIDNKNATDMNNNNNNNTNNDNDPPATCSSRIFKWLNDFYTANSFLILALCAILLALAYPPLGAEYLAPQITATWVAVIIIFLLSGISLKSEEFAKAFQRLKFNLFVQIFNFAVVSSITFGITRLLVLANALSQSLADGMTICSCVPITVNMVLVLTKSSDGDEAAAVFNAAFGNMMGIFISPALILLYLGENSTIDIGNVFFKLSMRVLVPIIIGQILQKFSKTVVNFVQAHKKKFKKVQELCLIFIIYTVFCRTFSTERDSSAADVFLMIAYQFVLLTSVMVLAWGSLRVFFSDVPKLRVMGVFGCTHKSVAVGIPLINAIYEDDPNIGFYTLPLLIWHPMQLVIGTFLSPRLAKFVKREEDRLGVNNAEVVAQEDDG